MELDVAEGAVYTLSSTLMGLDGALLAEEVDLIHSMVEFGFPVFPADIRGDPSPSGTREHDVGMRALEFLTSKGGRASIFHNKKKRFSRRHWTSVELEFMWWHRIHDPPPCDHDGKRPGSLGPGAHSFSVPGSRGLSPVVPGGCGPSDGCDSGWWLCGLLQDHDFWLLVFDCSNLRRAALRPSVCGR